MTVRSFARGIVAFAASIVIVLGSLLAGARVATAQTQTAVEYYYADWDYYFVTAFPDEIAVLDAGAFGGVWKRTGQTFEVWTGPTNGALPTCRFFTVTFAPKSSHFYTPYAAECEGLKSNPNWQFESIAFYLQLPDANGNCPPGTAILYRLYNNGMGGAPNHRFTTSLATFNQMRALGWIFEGNQVTSAFACVPSSSPPPVGPPVAYSVAAAKDDSRSVSSQIDPAGGTLTATGADGTVFTLTIPPNAIFFPTFVTMTPLDHVDRFPFSGGLHGGVQLEPEGLILTQTATLTIKPATAIPAAQLAPFNYSGGGDGFILYPAIAGAAGFQLPVSHFSGYGVGTGNTSAPPNAAPTGPFDPYVQQIAQVQVQLGADQLSPADANAQIQDLLTRAFNDVVIPNVQSVGNCDSATIYSAMRIGWQFVGLEEKFGDASTAEARKNEFYVQIKTLATACVDQAFEICKEQDDTGQGVLILSIAAALNFSNDITNDEYDEMWQKMERCLRFEVNFDSQITEQHVEGYENFFHVRAVVPVRLIRRNDSAFLLTGQATNQFLLATTTYLQGTPCSATIQTQDGVFEVGNLSLGGTGKREEIHVAMVYLPGSPTDAQTLACAGVSNTHTYTDWPTDFSVLHAGELLPSDPANPLFITREWETNPSGALVAMKTYQGTTPGAGTWFTELTTIFLRHTPDAP